VQIANIQSADQFASHRLNRDTWRNATVRSLIAENFVFFQAYDVVEEAGKVMSFYSAYELPATLVIDPVTGAPMRHWTGFLDAERLLEDLMPFLDTTIHDPGAARLAKAVTTKRKKFAEQELARQGSLGLSAGGRDNADEDEMLRKAIEASMRPASARVEQVNIPVHGEEEEDMVVQEDEDVEEEEEAAALKQSPKEVQEEAEARLPPEPATGEGCRIGAPYFFL
jgi:UBX domain-containing protein 7